MTNSHLPDEEIQAYALDKSACAKHVIEHIGSCETCRLAATTYQLLVAGIKEQPKPVLDFELTGLILAQLPPVRQKFSPGNFFAYLLAFLIAASAAVPLFLFRKNISNIITGISSLFLYLMIAAAAIVMMVKGFDLYKKYRQQLDGLNFTKLLQH
ncbi:MAG: hypothetical protein ABIQ31_14890 [Ferruginibacter sp.]